MRVFKTLLLPLLLIGSLIGFDRLEAATGPARHTACGWGAQCQSAPAAVLRAPSQALLPRD